MLEYRSPYVDRPDSKVVLWLTIYFFGGFLALMACLGCIALLVLSVHAGGYLAFGILTALTGLLTAYCTIEVLHLLRIDNPSQGPLDSRLDD